MTGSTSRTASEVLAVVAAQQRSLAVRLHDDAVQALAALTLRLQLLEDCEMSEDARALVTGMDASAARAATGLRAVMAELGGPPAVPGGIAAWAGRLGRALVGDQGTCRVVDELDAEIPAELATVLARVAQAAVHDAAHPGSRLTLVLGRLDDGGAVVGISPAPTGRAAARLTAALGGATVPVEGGVEHRLPAKSTRSFVSERNVT